MSNSRGGRFLRGALARLVLGAALALATAAPGHAQTQDPAPPGGSPGAPPPDPMVQGNRLYEKGDYAAAAEQYRKAALGARNGANRAFAWFNLGNCHVQSKAYHKAIVAYKRSIEQNPHFSRAWYVL